MKVASISRIVVAHPSDVNSEIHILKRVVENINRGTAARKGLNLQLATWETDSYPGFHLDGSQGLIDEVLKIEDCDLLIGIFWNRFGTPGKDGHTGTEHEFLKAYESWKTRGRPQIMVYFNQAPYRPGNDDEINQSKKLIEFKREFPADGLWWDYPNSDHFETLATRHLTEFVLGSSSFKADKFDLEITVEPLDKGPQETEYGGLYKPKTPTHITTDNRAHVLRTITFSNHNRCSDFFCLSYRTQNQGAIRIRDGSLAEIRKRHEVTPLTRRLVNAYDEHGHEVLYHFRPQRGWTYTLDIDVWKGFDEGRRHLRVICPRPTVCEEFHLKLDLKKFRNIGYKATEGPMLFFYSDEHDEPEKGEEVGYTTPSDGVWEWKISHVTLDSMYLKWDLAKSMVHTATIE